MALEKLQARLADVIPPEEVSELLRALGELSARPRKSMRFHRGRESREIWRSLGLPLGDEVPWCADGNFIDPDLLNRPEVVLFQAAGLGYIQEASAMEVAVALDPRPGDVVLDLCAAPGGKSTHVGEILGDSGWVVSNEIDRERVRSLDALLLRQGIVRSTVFSLFPDRLAELYPATFPKIVVDAPCSSESFFAKRSEKRTDVSDSEVRRCAKRQAKILDSAVILAAGNARVVYSTCTYSREENEDVTDAFLARYPEWRRVKEGRRFPHRDGVPGGYFAVLERGELGEITEDASPLRVRNSQGLVRNGDRRWDGEMDLYAKWMSAGKDSDIPSLDLSVEDALEFCAGKIPRVASESGEDLMLTWLGWPIGGLRTTKGKLTPVLPRSLRRSSGV